MIKKQEKDTLVVFMFNRPMMLMLEFSVVQGSPLFTTRITFTHQSLFSLFCHFLLIIADFVTTQYVSGAYWRVCPRDTKKNAGAIKQSYLPFLLIFLSA